MTRAKFCVWSAFLVLVPSLATATDRSFTAVAKMVYPSSNGMFAVSFDGDSPYCTNGGLPHKYYYVAVGQNGVTSDGHRLLYSTLLTAVVSGFPVTLVFDDSTANCYINRLNMTAP